MRKVGSTSTKKPGNSFAEINVQLTAKSLARILRNVDRAVLVEAIELAEFSDLFLTFEREVLIELGQTFNFLANLQVFGPLLAEKKFEELEIAIVEKYEGAPPPIKFFFDIANTVFEILRIALIPPPEPEPEPEPEPILREFVDITNNLRSAVFNISNTIRWMNNEIAAGVLRSGDTNQLHSANQYISRAIRAIDRMARG